MDAPETLSPEELAQLDAQYAPFPPLREWRYAVSRPELWAGDKREIEVLRQELDPGHLERAVEVALRAAAFDTGAIEGLYTSDRGLTMSVATQAAAWQQKVDERGPDVRAFFEAQLATYQLVMDVATQRLPVTEAWLRELHRSLTAPQATYAVMTPVGWQEQPLPRGDYKRFPNHVRLTDGAKHAYAPVDLTGAEMHRLVEELVSPEFAGAHPAEQASYAHYALACIHPFADGNGRVARALASVYLYRDASVPFLLFAEDRLVYWDALAAADRGDHQPFGELVFDAGRTAMGMVADTLRAALAPSAEEALRQFRVLLTAQGGLTHQELDTVGIRLDNDLLQVFGDIMQRLELPPGVTANVQSTNFGGGQQVEAPSGFRRIVAGGSRYVQLYLSSAPPAQASRTPMFEVFVSTDRDREELFRIVQEGQRDEVRFSLREVYPQLSVSGQHRLRTFSERVVGRELHELLLAAAAAMKESD